MLDPGVVPLFYLSSLAGLVMVVGGIWLIYKQKIYIDRESKQVTEIETPFGKFKTNLPAILLFLIGFIFLGYPILKVSDLTTDSTRTVNITGMVNSDEEPVVAYAVVDEQTMWKDKQLRLTVPIPKPGQPSYAVLVRAGPMIDKRTVESAGRNRNLVTGTFTFSKAPSEPAGVATDFVVDTIPMPAAFQR